MPLRSPSPLPPSLSRARSPESPTSALRRAEGFPDNFELPGRRLEQFRPAALQVPPVQPPPVRRALAAQFDAAAFGTAIEEADEMRLGSPASVSSAAGSEDSFDPMHAWGIMQHDEARDIVSTLCPSSVRATLALVAEILARDVKPSTPPSGTHTPLWQEKVELLSPTFLDILPSVVLARRLQAIHHEQCSHLELFDHEGNREIFARITTQLTALLDEGRDIASIGQAVERGLETARWDGDARYHTLGKLIVEASHHLPALDGGSVDNRKFRTALVNEAINPRSPL